MPSHKLILLTTAATALPTVFAVYTTASNCFTIQGAFANGTGLGYLRVGKLEHQVKAAFTGSPSAATKFGLDPATSSLVDYDGAPYTGFLATGPWDARGFSSLNFDAPQDLLDQEMTEHIALVCELGPGGALTCAHPRVPAYSVIQFCTRYGPYVAIREFVQEDWDCEAIVLTAAAATGCTVPTSTPTATPVPTTTIMTLPTGTGVPERRYLCTPGGPTLCADGFLVKCNKLPYNTASNWYMVPGLDSERKCHQTCVGDATCGGWQYFEEEIDLLSCLHTHDTFSPNTQFRFEYYFYSTGARGICQ